MRELLASALLVACFSLVAFADTRRRTLASSGAWRLFRVDSYRLAVGNGERAKIDGACVTEAIAEGVHLDFIILIPDENHGREPLFGSVIVQASSPQWSFRQRQANLSLVSGALTLTVVGSLYDFDTVNFNMGGYGQLPVALRLFVETAAEPIEIVDDRDVSIARFPSNGLRETFNEMLKCGTV